MATQLRWLVEKRVILAHMWGNVTVEELREVNTRKLEFLRTGTAPIHDLLDTTGLKQYPVKLRDLESYLGYLREPAMGMLIFVKLDSAAARLLAKMLGAVMGVRMGFADSLEEGYAALRQYDPTLPEYPVVPEG
ncbi:MAG: hypothetical protein HXY40_13755 [Chloroflexi bacterium]|nr:hypothetical protein [Chloroflexota bacterium]